MYRTSVSPGLAERIMAYLTLTAAKFKPPVFPALVFTLSDVVNRFILGIFKATCKSRVGMRLGQLPIGWKNPVLHVLQFENVCRKFTTGTDVSHCNLISGSWTVNLILALNRSLLLYREIIHSVVCFTTGP
jgi:hypothetical protein